MSKPNYRERYVCGLLMFIPLFLSGCCRAVVFPNASEERMRWLASGKYAPEFVRRHHLMPSVRAWLAFYDWAMAEQFHNYLRKNLCKTNRP